MTALVQTVVAVVLALIGALVVASAGYAGGWMTARNATNGARLADQRLQLMIGLLLIFSALWVRP